jgi:hypothetical protein
VLPFRKQTFEEEIKNQVLSRQITPFEDASPEASAATAGYRQGETQAFADVRCWRARPAPSPRSVKRLPAARRALALERAGHRLRDQPAIFFLVALKAISRWRLAPASPHVLFWRRLRGLAYG